MAGKGLWKNVGFYGVVVVVVAQTIPSQWVWLVNFTKPHLCAA